MNAIMSRAVPGDSQGELQGGVASLASVSAIVGPFSMTQTLSAFTRPESAWHFAGAAFVLAAILTTVSAALMVRARVQQTVA
jgi:DHA1 family tetracycline resistance protein-like MFS transporter